MTRSGPPRTPQRAQQSQPQSQQAQPLWWRVTFLGVMALALQYGLTLLPSDGLSGRLAGVATSHAMWFWLAGGALITIGILTRVLGGSGQDANPEEVARTAVATHLKIPPEQVRVTVHRKLLPRVQRQHGPRLRRDARRVTIQLPLGRVLEDPGTELARQLGGPLGPLRKHRWNSRSGKCVLVAGQPDHSDEAPTAATDPRKRAEQVLIPVVGKELHSEVTQHDQDGSPSEITIRHEPTLRVNRDKSRALQQRVDERMPTHGDRGWGVDIQPERDTIRIYQRPAMPNFVPHPVIADYTALFNSQDQCGADPALYGPEPRVLPCATDEFNRICGWNISRKTNKPHALLIGPTGGGKTNAITTMVIGAARQGAVNSDIAIWGIDPKMIELMGLTNFPGVTQLAFRIDDMAATITAAYNEMMHRYDLIAQYKIHPEDLPPLVLILDEYLILVSMLTYWWKNQKGGKGACPQINQLTQMLALSRSAMIYILLGVQRPDASLFSEGARDNLRFRGSLGELSPEGAKMVWNDESVGVRPVHTTGRGVILGPDGAPVEAQYWYTPHIDPNPMYRDRLNPEDRSLVESLTPTMYSPRSLTLDDLELPSYGEAPRSGGVEFEMHDVQEVVRARDLNRGDIIKMEDESDRMSRAYVDDIDYDDQSRTASITIHWDGGSAEDMDLSGDEQIWYVGQS